MNPREDSIVLLMILHGKDPIHKNITDSRGWGNAGNFTVKEGYHMVHKRKNRLMKNNRWNKIWIRDGLPKINVFFWILALHKMLTAENLRKRGIIGSSFIASCVNRRRKA